MSIKNKFPNIKPSLNLDFANTKQIDPRITFTRASTATYWDGVTHAKAEENLLKYSQEFDNSFWSKTNVAVSANAAAAPDGTLTADSVVGNATVGTLKLVHTGSSNVGRSGTFTATVYAKAGTHSILQILWSGNDGNAYANFDLSLGVLGTYTGIASITSIGNGWYRCTSTYTFAVSNQSPGFCLVDSSSAARAAPSSASGNLLIWGAQLEERSAATAYTPTTDQPITKYQPALRTAASGTPRFDHNPVTGESLGLLIEEQKTNLLLNSGDLSGVNLTAGSRTANAIVAPDGSLGASVINGVGGGAASTWTQSAVATAARMTFSCYVKTGLLSSATSHAFLVRNSTTGTSFSAGVFNLTTGAITGTGWSSTHVGNGWYRISYTNQASETITAGNLITCYFGATGGIAYATSVALGLWGAQLEAGSFPTSYIPTASAQVTRASEAAAMTGANFSSWYRQDEGTLYSEASLPSVSGLNMCVLALTDGSYNNVIACFADVGYGLYVFNTGSTQAALAAGAYSSGLSEKSAGSYAKNSFATCLNSSSVATDYSGVVPSLSQLWIGVFTNNYRLNGTIKKIAYYPKRLSNTELQTLTA